MHPSKFFRAGVGILLIDDAGLVLAFERAQPPDSWQLPQGGLDRDEAPRDAAERELAEETGLRCADVTLIGEYPGWLTYELPDDFRSERVGRGQAQRWFAYRCSAGAEKIRFDTAGPPEFSAVAHMPMAELIDRTMPFRRAVYAALAQEFAAILR